MLKILNKLVLIFLCFSLGVNADDQKTSYNILNNSNLVQWQLVLIDYSSDSSPDFEHRDILYKSLNNVVIKSNYHSTSFNNDSFDIKEIMDELPQDIHNLLLKELKHFNLNSFQQDKKCFSFIKSPTQYDLNQYLVFISDYLFLFSNDGFVLTFKNEEKIRNYLASQYDKLKSVKLPLTNRFWPLESKDEFSPFSDELVYFFKGSIDDSDAQSLKLQKYNDINLLLLSSYTIAGAPQLSIVSLDNSFKFIDRLELSQEYELEDGVSWIKYNIDKNYFITLNEVEYRHNKSPKSVSKTFYKISDKGKFIKVNK
ncbi:MULTISPECIES: hypothetical protein [Gilliamella]|uniref:Uncharacterized protein n=1 Tax=Gilliamella apicola TaxID=1196095 RepID=A0A556SB46_9GAMM|nr:MULTISPECIES: hypothetical protein [Gilliamella]MBI0095551.1 hypothetical protein [Gilliamella sp. W8136]TSJ98367.1 hypothetical protein FPQ15_09300 [Gilliamella apicola]